MIISKTDQKVLEFLETFGIATTDTIAELFYSSLRYCQYRLKAMNDNKILKRDRDHFTHQYYYYLKKPRQLRHSLLLTNFYREVNKLVNVKSFKKEITIGDIRPDGIIAYEHKRGKHIACVEVQISNTPLDIDKYERLHMSKKYRRYFPTFPLIIAITNKRIPDTKLKIIQVGEDIENLKEVLE